MQRKKINWCRSVCQSDKAFNLLLFLQHHLFEHWLFGYSLVAEFEHEFIPPHEADQWIVKRIRQLIVKLLWQKNFWGKFCSGLLIFYVFLSAITLYFYIILSWFRICLPLTSLLCICPIYLYLDVGFVCFLPSLTSSALFTCSLISETLSALPSSPFIEGTLKERRAKSSKEASLTVNDMVQGQK